MNWGFALIVLGVIALIVVVYIDNYKDGKRIKRRG